MKVFADTSAWAAYFNRKDVNHGAAIRIWEELRDKRAILFTTDYVVDETFTLLKVRVNVDAAVKGGEAILTSALVKMIKVSDEVFADALKIFKRYKEHPFSFTDCTSFAVMKKMALDKVFTFDSDFKTVGFEILK